MYIVENKKWLLGPFYVLLIGFFIEPIEAHELYIDSICSTQLFTNQTLICVYAEGGYYSNGILFTATNNRFNRKNIDDNSLESTLWGGGIATEIYNTKCKWLRIAWAIGYKYQKYYYTGDTLANAGIHNHLLTATLKTKFMFYEGMYVLSGLFMDGLLKTAISNDDNYTYVGFNKDCFNKLSLGCYVGGAFAFPDFELEILLGIYIIPQLNPNKIAYYNQIPTTVNACFLDVRVSIPIYTTF